MHEVVGSLLGRIEEIDAYVTMPGDGARGAAERALYSGGGLGPLHGVPVGMQLMGRRFDETLVRLVPASFRANKWDGFAER